MVMLIPLGFLAFGSIMAGLPFKEIFAGHGVEGFFRESLTFAKSNTVLEDMHHVPLEIGILPTVMMAIGFVIAWHFYIRRPDIPVELARQHERALPVPAQQMVLRRALRLHLRASRPSGSARCSGRAATAG